MLNDQSGKVAEFGFLDYHKPVRANATMLHLTKDAMNPRIKVKSRQQANINTNLFKAPDYFIGNLFGNGKQMHRDSTVGLVDENSGIHKQIGVREWNESPEYFQSKMRAIASHDRFNKEKIALIKASAKEQIEMISAKILGSLPKSIEDNLDDNTKNELNKLTAKYPILLKGPLSEQIKYSFDQIIQKHGIDKVITTIKKISNDIKLNENERNIARNIKMHRDLLLEQNKKKISSVPISSAPLSSAPLSSAPISSASPPPRPPHPISSAPLSSASPPPPNYWEYGKYDVSSKYGTYDLFPEKGKYKSSLGADEDEKEEDEKEEEEELEENRPRLSPYIQEYEEEVYPRSHPNIQEYEDNPYSLKYYSPSKSESSSRRSSKGSLLGELSGQVIEHADYPRTQRYSPTSISSQSASSSRSSSSRHSSVPSQEHEQLLGELSGQVIEKDISELQEEQDRLQRVQQQLQEEQDRLDKIEKVKEYAIQMGIQSKARNISLDYIPTIANVLKWDSDNSILNAWLKYARNHRVNEKSQQDFDIMYKQIVKQHYYIPLIIFRVKPTKINISKIMLDQNIINKIVNVPRLSPQVHQPPRQTQHF